MIVELLIGGVLIGAKVAYNRYKRRPRDVEMTVVEEIHLQMVKRELENRKVKRVLIVDHDHSLQPLFKAFSGLKDMDLECFLLVEENKDDVKISDDTFVICTYESMVHLDRKARGLVIGHAVHQCRPFMSHVILVNYTPKFGVYPVSARLYRKLEPYMTFIPPHESQMWYLKQDHMTMSVVADVLRNARPLRFPKEIRLKKPYESFPGGTLFDREDIKVIWDDEDGLELIEGPFVPYVPHDLSLSEKKVVEYHVKTFADCMEFMGTWVQLFHKGVILVVTDPEDLGWNKHTLRRLPWYQKNAETLYNVVYMSKKRDFDDKDFALATYRAMSTQKAASAWWARHFF